MANIVRFDPFTELTRLRPFGDIGEFFKDSLLRPGFRGWEAEPQIKIDVSENDKAYTVKAEVPGVKKEDVEVSVDGNQVSISAEVKKEKEEKQGEKILRSERYYGKQYRSFTLGCDIDETKADAKYCDGVLELTLPKKPGSEAKRLAVK
jgi:HSP20 family protein